MSLESSENSLGDELEGLFNERDTSGQVEAIKQLFDKKNIKMKSDVDPVLNESEYFSKLALLGKFLKAPGYRDYALEVLEHRVSNKRAGRREAVQMTQTIHPQEQKRGFFSRLMGN